MNLHGLVGPIVGAVNPNVPATLRVSTGYATNADGSRTPSYAPGAPVTAQVQQLTTRDLMHLDALNVQGSQRKIYLYGRASAIVRASQKGGDLVILGDGTIWLTTAVIEQWPDWVCVAVTQQIN